MVREHLTFIHFKIPDNCISSLKVKIVKKSAMCSMPLTIYYTHINLAALGSEEILDTIDFFNTTKKLHKRPLNYIENL